MIERILINEDINFIKETIKNTNKPYIQFMYIGNDVTFDFNRKLEGDIICLVEQSFEDSMINRYINCYSIQNRLYSTNLLKMTDFSESLTRTLNKLFVETLKITILENLLYQQIDSNTYFEEAIEILDIFDFEMEMNNISKFKKIILPERIFSEEKYQNYLLKSIELNDKELDV